MIIHEGVDQIRGIKNPVVTSGTFDGVHIGHQKILKRIRHLADEIDGETVLITFWPHPRLVLYPEEHQLRLLSTFEEKVKLLADFGVDHLVTIPFTREFSEMSSQEFIQEIIVRKIQTKKLVIGYDHRFGKNREGSFEYLIKNHNQYGFELEEIPREDVDNIGVSSTKIRKSLEEGKIQAANEFLGRNYELSGIIIKGQQLGRSIGFPTANIQILNDYKLIPSNGVYAVHAQIEEMRYLGMLNIGNRPTVGGTNRTIEVHLFDFDGNLYDRRITIHFQAFLRPEIKFDNLNALKEQLIQDQQSSIEILSQI
jgi:riboflavin kinase / FMN adenylyltransferase